MKRSIIISNARRVSFRKWGNKSFSIFSSLKALIKICTVSATYSFLVLPKTACAQPDTITINSDVDIDEVVITSPMAASTYSELLRAVVIITPDQISQQAVSSLQELLNNLASVDIRQRGGHGVQADLMIRGGTFDQVLILLNGINITDPQTGHHNLNIPIDLESIERIELLQGPGTRLYGPGTFSGAINIITSSPGKNFAKVGLTAGQYGLIKSNASAAIQGENSNLFVSGSSSKSDGFMKNTDFNLQSLFAHAGITKNSNKIDFQAGYQDKSFGAQSFYTPRFPEQFEHTSTFISSLSFTKKIDNLSISISGYHRGHNDQFELFRRQTPDWYNGHNYHKTLVSGGKITLSSLSSAGRSRLGLEYRNETIYSNVLGDVLPTPKPIRGFADTTYTRGKSRDFINLFADHTIYLKRLVLSAGGLMSQNQQYGVSLNYGIDISLRLMNQLSMISSVNNSVRIPTFTDLYYNGPTNLGNINLRPEKSDNFEIGLKHNSLWYNAKATIFHRRGKDVIDWVRESEEDIWTTTNHTEINTTGIESFAYFNTAHKIPIIKSISIGYHYMISDKRSGGLISYYALDYLKQKVTVNISHSIANRISATWSANWQDRAGTYTEYETNKEVAYKPFLIIHVRTSFNLNGFSAFVDVNNIMNMKYSDLGNIPQSGRWVSAGISYKLEK